MQSWSHGVPGCHGPPRPCRATAAPTPSAAWRCGRGGPGCGRPTRTVPPPRCTPCCTGSTWRWSACGTAPAVSVVELIGQQPGRANQLNNNAGRTSQDSDHTIRPSLLQARCRCGCASPSSGTGRASCGAPSSTDCSTTQVRGAGAVVTRQGDEVGSCVELLSLLFQYRRRCTPVPTLSHSPARPMLSLHADPSTPPAGDDLIASLDEHMSGSRDAARQLRQELSAAAQLLPRLC